MESRINSSVRCCLGHLLRMGKLSSWISWNAKKFFVKPSTWGSCKTFDVDATLFLQTLLCLSKPGLSFLESFKSATHFVKMLTFFYVASLTPLSEALNQLQHANADFFSVRFCTLSQNQPTAENNTSSSPACVHILQQKATFHPATNHGERSHRFSVAEDLYFSMMWWCRSRNSARIPQSCIYCPRVRKVPLVELLTNNQVKIHINPFSTECWAFERQ